MAYNQSLLMLDPRMKRAWLKVEIAKKKMEDEQAVELEKKLYRIRNGLPEPPPPPPPAPPPLAEPEGGWYVRNMATQEKAPLFYPSVKKIVMKTPQKWAMVVRNGKVMGSLEDSLFFPAAEVTMFNAADSRISSKVDFWDATFLNNGSFVILDQLGSALLSLAGPGGYQELKTEKTGSFFNITSRLPDGDHWFESNFQRANVYFLAIGKPLRTCDLCRQDAHGGQHCAKCSDGDFDVCHECYARHGHDRSHTLQAF